MTNLVEGLLAEINRLRDQVIPQYESVAGLSRVNIALGVHMMRASIAAAERAIGEGDTVAMLRCLSDLREYDT